MKAIEFENVKKAYGDNVVIPNINFDVDKGERLVLLGPSGCGKSTLLRMIAGLEDIQNGTVKLNGNDMKNVALDKRDVAMVFQNYALYPHMTVERNITYGLKAAKMKKDEVEERLDEALRMLDLTEYKNRTPKQLSGGQRQRVALARATVKRRSIFLLDEPLSNLDAQLRVSARQALLDIHDRYKQTMVYVTHDQIEAMTFATKIILLSKGEIQMWDKPYEVYHHPRNIFTAKFIGSPPMNLIPDVRIWMNRAKFGKQQLYLMNDWHGFLSENKDYTMGIRSENIILHKENVNEKYVSATVRYIENQGANFAVYLDVDGTEIISTVKNLNCRIGENLYAEFLQSHLHFFDSETELNVGRPEHLKEVNFDISEMYV